MVMEGIQEDISENNMQCINHPYKNSSPNGGICAFCLQEKLGKLVSNSFSSLRSDFVTTSTTTTTTSTLPLPRNNKNATDSCNNNNCHPYDTMRKPRMQFLMKKKKESDHDSSIVFKRSKSTTTTSRNHIQYLEAAADHGSNEAYGPHRKGFWSFLHYSSSKHYSTGSVRSREKKKEEFVVVDEENESSPDEEAAFDRKVARSRSVGCGSRSFSGDLFERITGFGDCTLRRVESHREGNKPRFSSVVHHKERVNCGGIFSGFMITSSEENVNGKSHFANGRSKNWGWALASPMRAFSKTSSSSGKREDSNKSNATPNLAAIPSLLTVSS